MLRVGSSRTGRASLLTAFQALLFVPVRFAVVGVAALQKGVFGVGDGCVGLQLVLGRIAPQVVRFPAFGYVAGGFVVGHVAFGYVFHRVASSGYCPNGEAARL